LDNELNILQMKGNSIFIYRL